MLANHIGFSYPRYWCQILIFYFLLLACTGDDFLPSSPLFGKPLAEQHVYLPYYEGNKMQSRKSTTMSDVIETISVVVSWSVARVSIFLVLYHSTCTRIDLHLYWHVYLIFFYMTAGIHNIHYNCHRNVPNWETCKLSSHLCIFVIIICNYTVFSVTNIV